VYLSDPNTQRILHKFGDSFAHVQSDGTHYNSGNGHLVDGTTPDNPATHQNAYRNYVTALYNAASSVSGDPRVTGSSVSNLANRVIASGDTVGAQQKVLYNSFGQNRGLDKTGLTRAPVKDCELNQNCQKLPVGSQVAPLIWGGLGAIKGNSSN
jgi:filamentous hemagglutinin